MSERSISKDIESDSDSPEAQSVPGKPGRKKNPNSQAARRDQNRIAQREFRLRKQQRIRDLEARVEILSGGKDEAMGEMGNILKDLMQENQTLRNLLRSLSVFIGDGAGGLLTKLGWDMSDFNNFINKTETDTAWEGYQRRKKASASAEVLLNPGQKRPAEEDLSSSKKPRTSDPSESYSILLPNTSMYSSRQHEGPGMFSDVLRNGGPATSPIFMQQPSGPSTSSPPFNTQPAGAQPYQSSYPPAIDNSLPPMNYSSTSPPVSTLPSRTTAQPQSATPDQFDDDEDPNKNEAYKLIHYHLDNFKRNSAYCLPSSLRPTLVQRTVPHESVIDRILHPEVRDRMILYRNRFDLVDCLLDYRNDVTIHGDDVLAHSNWEIGEKWLRKYGYLVDPVTLNIMNRWRRERGEVEIRLSDLTQSESTTGSS
ncbi:hypothetical protein E1B28_004524 [Marasmius oreades]|uniref:BZIP domain-containing protein n=1 Tax=Marasmius oreades TaxID=181124 RepID=A0A9P7UYQ9_9AGAR|nr:uncharacterized protein E1B28_004524 [Marasmius oreades]KAG7097146.1 hypothetical protein E1B28_004524 [Marasmius oreades]